MGRPDPAAPPPPPKELTHYPHSNGAVCGVQPVPTHARHYDPVDPTCPKCASWFAATKAVTLARYGPPRVVNPSTPPSSSTPTKPPEDDAGEGQDDEA